MQHSDNFIFCRNYPSWLFVEPADNSSSASADLETARDCGAEIVVVECSPAPRHTRTQVRTRLPLRNYDKIESRKSVNFEILSSPISILNIKVCVVCVQDDSDSEDEGWYSLSRTDVRKLQEVRGRQDVNIILTNPDIDILHLCAEDEAEEEEEDMDGEDERKQESSPERTSYRCVAAGRHQLIRCAAAPRPSQAENYLAGGNWEQLQTNSVGQCSLIACYP